MSEQLNKDIESSNTKREEAKAGVAKLHKELATLNKQLGESEVCTLLPPPKRKSSTEFSCTLQDSHSKAERKLQEERATLTRFDNELKELERVIKEKKQAVADADLELTKLQHDAQVLAKEKTAAVNYVANLEKQHEWIAEESS